MIWKTLRVAASTLTALNKYRDALQVQVNANHAKYQRFAPTFRVSLGGAIDYLIAQKDAHTKRGAGTFNPGGRDKDKYSEFELRKALGFDSEFEERTSRERP